MNNVEWILIDTETNGLKAPIYAFDIGAQLMRGWELKGKPFQMFINHDIHVSTGITALTGKADLVSANEAETDERGLACVAITSTRMQTFILG